MPVTKPRVPRHCLRRHAQAHDALRWRRHLRLDVNQVGYEWVNHSLAPTHIDPASLRITVGSPQCTKLARRHATGPRRAPPLAVLTRIWPPLAAVGPLLSALCPTSASGLRSPSPGLFFFFFTVCMIEFLRNA